MVQAPAHASAHVVLSQAFTHYDSTILAGEAAGGYKDGFVMRVNVPSEYVAPFVSSAFALHPALPSIISDDNKELPDLIVRKPFVNKRRGLAIYWLYSVFFVAGPKQYPGKKDGGQLLLRSKGLSGKAQLKLNLFKYIMHLPEDLLRKVLRHTIELPSDLQLVLVESEPTLDNENRTWIMMPSAANRGDAVNLIKYLKCPQYCNEFIGIRITSFFAAGADADNNSLYITNTPEEQRHPGFVESVYDYWATLKTLWWNKASLVLLGEPSVFQPPQNGFDDCGVDFTVEEDFNVSRLAFYPDALSFLTNAFFFEDKESSVKDVEIGAFAKMTISKGSSMKFVG
ncbi:hypothetical protein GN244_ATG09253 [Phytophthora infestans]|uniref:Uncharacterized protein n=1 Tax=Phytophthora infestans TaxID=4787 RepID=A0A833SU33_PHYIN|nr:hypothetical protein GN244_ATG09253 [Phytophthora infestans]KAF4132310.1 hypothetical protein GN958_ATG18427 [Phytophthora infestans]KAF4132312.1 hypothetical protein GN958_ATG18429 [Phytophthora infestans]KAF4141286.1 hypothetical protein GN958_ATG09551 [Phytophthora infestans]